MDKPTLAQGSNYTKSMKESIALLNGNMTANDITLVDW